MKYLIDAYYRQVEAAYAAKKLSQTCYERLKSREIEELEDLDEPVADFTHSLMHAEYYILIDRIDAGLEMLAKETDDTKKAQYRHLLNDLTAKLESLTPRGETA